MKIKNIRLFPITTPREAGAPSQHIIVKLVTDEGPTGFGEMPDFTHLPALMPDVADLERTLNHLLTDCDPLEIEKANERLKKYFPQGPFWDKSSLVRCGVDLALYDLVGKVEQKPVYGLIGGKFRERIPVSYPIFRQKRREEIPENIARMHRLMARGFSAFRYYFGANLDVDETFLAEVAKEFGDKVIMASLDGSGLFEKEGFLAAYERLAQFDFLLIESPVRRDDIEGLNQVKEAIAHPVSEHIQSPANAKEFARLGAVDVFNISLSAAGGISEAKEIAKVAQASGIKILVGTTQETSIATAASAHFGASLPHLDYYSNPVGPVLYTQDVTKEPVHYEDSHLIVPQGPGLGVEVDEGKFEELKENLTAAYILREDFQR